MAPKRLARLSQEPLAAGLRLVHARSLRARLLGLALLREPPAGVALAIVRCRSVHTFGMRFPIDVVFVDASGRVVGLHPAVRACRVVSCRRASWVVEAPAGDGVRIAAALTRRARRGARAAASTPSARGPR